MNTQEIKNRIKNLEERAASRKSLARKREDLRKAQGEYNLFRIREALKRAVRSEETRRLVETLSASTKAISAWVEGPLLEMSKVFIEDALDSYALELRLQADELGEGFDALIEGLELSDLQEELSELQEEEEEE